MGGEPSDEGVVRLGRARSGAFGRTVVSSPVSFDGGLGGVPIHYPGRSGFPGSVPLRSFPRPLSSCRRGRCFDAGGVPREGPLLKVLVSPSPYFSVCVGQGSRCRPGRVSTPSRPRTKPDYDPF